MSRRLDGPAAPEDKLVWDHLKRRKGMKNTEIPRELRDTVAASTPRDALGKIEVRRMTGLCDSPAARVVRRFEEVAGGKEQILEVLEAVASQLDEKERAFLELMRGSRKDKSMARLLAEAGIAPMKILKQYSEGLAALGRMQTAIELAKEQPAVVKDLMRHVLDQTTACDICVGSGTVPSREGALAQTQPCPQCKGTGQSLVSSEHKKFAMENYLKMTKLVEEKSGITLQQNQNVALQVNSGGSFLEKVLKTNEEILYGKPAQVIDVQPEDHSSDSS